MHLWRCALYNLCWGRRHRRFIEHVVYVKTWRSARIRDRWGMHRTVEHHCWWWLY